MLKLTMKQSCVKAWILGNFFVNLCACLFPCQTSCLFIPLIFTVSHSRPNWLLNSEKKASKSVKIPAAWFKILPKYLWCNNIFLHFLNCSYIVLTLFDPVPPSINHLQHTWPLILFLKTPVCHNNKYTYQFE